MLDLFCDVDEAFPLRGERLKLLSNRLQLLGHLQSERRVLVDLGLFQGSSELLLTAFQPQDSLFDRRQLPFDVFSGARSNLSSVSFQTLLIPVSRSRSGNASDVERFLPRDQPRQLRFGLGLFHVIIVISGIKCQSSTADMQNRSGN